MVFTAVLQQNGSSGIVALVRALLLCKVLLRKLLFNLVGIIIFHRKSLDSLFNSTNLQSRIASVSQFNLVDEC